MRNTDISSSLPIHNLQRIQDDIDFELKDSLTLTVTAEDLKYVPSNIKLKLLKLFYIMKYGR